jgi:HEPN domain-containing protein
MPPPQPPKPPQKQQQQPKESKRIPEATLREAAAEKLKDAEVLFNGQRYDATVYLCGYVIELILKARICKVLRFVGGYPAPGEKHEYGSLLTHKLDVLLRLSGKEAAKKRIAKDWSIVSDWNSEMRYDAPGSITQGDAEKRLEATKRLINKL